MVSKGPHRPPSKILHFKRKRLPGVCELFKCTTGHHSYSSHGFGGTKGHQPGVGKVLRGSKLPGPGQGRVLTSF